MVNVSEILLINVYIKLMEIALYVEKGLFWILIKESANLLSLVVKPNYPMGFVQGVCHQ